MIGPDGKTMRQRWEEMQLENARIDAENRQRAASLAQRIADVTQPPGESTRTRRGNGEGTKPKRRKDGLYQVQIRLNGVRHSFYGKTPGEASRKKTEASRNAQKGLPIPSERYKVKTFLEEWLKNTQARLKPKTWQRYSEIVTLHLIPELGNTPLSRLSAPQVQALYSKKLADGLSQTTVHHLHTVLHGALEKALKQGLVAFNVTDRVDAPAICRQEMQVLSEDQAARFLEAVAGDRFEALYVLALYTGMRQGELLGLQWQDIDLKRGVLQVQHTLENVRGKMRLADPKTATSRRTIRLPEPALAALEAHRKQQLAGDMISPLVFCTYQGGPIEASRLIKLFHRLLDKAGLPRMRFHQLRHTAATHAIARGAPVKAVSEMLGHADVGTTLRIYGHVTPDMQQQVVDVMNAVFRR